MGMGRGTGMGQIGVGVNKRGLGGNMQDRSIYVLGLPRLYTFLILYTGTFENDAVI